MSKDDHNLSTYAIVCMPFSRMPEEEKSYSGDVSLILSNSFPDNSSTDDIKAILLTMCVVMATSECLSPYLNPRLL